MAAKKSRARKTKRTSRAAEDRLVRRFVVILEDVNSKLAALADALTAMREHLERRLDRLAAFERPFDDLASKLDTKADASSVDPLEARMR